MVPLDVSLLIRQRDQARSLKKYDLADRLRQQIIKLGYDIHDSPTNSQANLSHTPLSRTSYLALFGSGETSTPGRLIHETILKHIGKRPVKIALISTPAGFQPNVAVVYSQIASFFKTHLTNFHPQVEIIYANTVEKANDIALIEPLTTADYIFAGPGSPTYAVNHLSNTRLLDMILTRIKIDHISLGLASAAAVAFSALALPVYEIYKVGSPLHWQPGLNVFTKLFHRLTIIPHFNNSEGGPKTDTSHCFMGKTRFVNLLKLLPPTEPLWGIDELTGVVINLNNFFHITLGKGKLYSFTPSSFSLSHTKLPKLKIPTNLRP